MKKILIVDDEESIVQLLKTILKEDGYNIETAIDGKEALEKIKKKKFDLVLLDMFMPGLSGREVCEMIRFENQAVKIIFVTVASFSELGQSELEKMKVDDYISKPFDNEDVKKRVKKVLFSGE